ncbi:MAG: diguanylate cyclase, partial [Magnetococcales bacterium]|nr:diguanylate cyclase [Magnetococcales bacterium]
EVCHHIKNNLPTRDIPIIFITGNNQIEDETRCFNVGAVDYITKPFHPAVVLARVKSHIELKRRGDMLDENKMFVTSIIDSLTEHVAVIDANGVISAVNASWLAFAVANGVTDMARVSIGSNYFEICGHATNSPNGKEAPTVLSGIKAVLAETRSNFTLEYPCHSPNATRWFMLHVLPLQGEKKGAVLIHENITERYQADAALRTSEAHFRMLAENMVDVVWKADRKMRFTYINDADCLLRGFSRDEVVGRPIADTLTPEGQLILEGVLTERRQLEDNGQGNQTLHFTVPQRCKDGREIWFDILSIPIYDAEGRISGFQGIGRDITEQKKREADQKAKQRQLKLRLEKVSAQKMDLEEKVTRDPLTGAYNRRYLDETLPLELSKAQCANYPVAVIMIDLDHFKRVNDTYSHAAGDEVIKSLVTLLKRSARSSDIICRYGGEEFVLIMPKMSLAMALERMESSRQEMANMTIPYGEHGIQVTLSAGIAAFPDHGQDAGTLLSHADEVLYQAKHEGRNRVFVYRPSFTFKKNQPLLHSYSS